MKIALVGPQYPDSFAKCISIALMEMGHDVFTIDEHEILPSAHLPTSIKMHDVFKIKAWENILIKGSPSFEKWVYRSLCKRIENFGPNLIITITATIPPRAISRLRKETDAKIVLWFPDSLSNYGREYIFAADFDALFFKDPYIVEFCKDKINKKAYYLPECCQPRWHRRIKLTEEERNFYGCDLAVAGNLYYYRALIIEHLSHYNYNIKLWGPPIPRWLNTPIKSLHTNRYVAEVEKAKAFNAARIVLNTIHPTEIMGVNARTFEIAGCGGFQICDFKAELPELFTLDQEIIAFHNLNDLREKVAYYLAHPEEMEKISDRAYKRAHSEHTYAHRMRRMLRILGYENEKRTGNHKERWEE